jgi:endonuclease YncB( thermonuclease family)
LSELTRFEPRWKAKPQPPRLILRIPRGPWPIIAMMVVIGSLAYFKPDFSRFMPHAKPTTEKTKTMTGSARVIDGDTVEIGGERIRFNGIDSPEMAQTCEDAGGRSYRCGATAKQALNRFLDASQPIRCDFTSRDRYGRFVGNCFRADNASVSAYLVRNGFAMNWARYGGTYANDQNAAKAERLGIWSGTAQPPWEWRAEHSH